MECKERDKEKEAFEGREISIEMQITYK